MGVSRKRRIQQETNPLEEHEQELIFRWAWKQKGWEGVCPIHPPAFLHLMYAVPNGGKRSKAEASRMARQGTRRGVSDMVLPVAKDGFHALYLELKRLKGSKTSEEQLQWRDDMLAQGNQALIIKGHVEAIKAILFYSGVQHKWSPEYPVKTGISKGCVQKDDQIDHSDVFN